MERLRFFIGITVFWLGLSVIGDGFAALVVPFRLAGLTDPGHAATLIGLVTFVGLLVGTATQPIAGAASDALHARWGRSGTLLIGVVLTLPALAAFATLPTVVGVLVAFVLLQVGLNVAQASQQGYVPDLVDEGWRGRASGLKGFADLAGAFIGFLALGALLANGDPTPAVAFAGLFLVVAALIAVRIVRERRLFATNIPRSTLRSVFEIDLPTHRTFVRVVAARFLFLLGTFTIGRYLLLFVAERLGIDPTTAADETGALLAALTLVTAFAAIPGGWLADRIGRPQTMAIGSLLAAVGASLLIVADSAPAILIFGGLLSVGTAVFVASNWAMTVDLVPQTEAARFLGLANIGTGGAAAAAGLLGPPIDLIRGVVPTLGYGVVLIAALVTFVAALGVVRALVPAVAPPAPVVAPIPPQSH
jgi:MFS family permease